MESTERMTRRRPGRPVTFDREKVLDEAMRQFWRTGYETTSVNELTAAMGITAPSLYAAFTDKESLFLECVERYSNPGPVATSVWIQEAASAREAAQQLLETSATWFTQPGGPAGCLVASAASSGSESSEAVRAALKQVRSSTIEALRARTEKDKRIGKLPKSVNARTLALMTMSVIQGMSTLARDGVSRQGLLQIAKAAMAAWPTDQDLSSETESEQRQHLAKD